MSKFSGKCDFYDHLFMSANSEEEAFKKFKGTKLYKSKPQSECVELDMTNEDTMMSTIKQNQEEIHYQSLTDLVQYYPYIISMESIDNTDSNNSYIVLSSRSWVDIEEEHYGKMRMHQYYRDALQEELEKYQS